jgi:hypothetical protein
VKKHLDSDNNDGIFYKKLILTHHKNLCIQRRAWLIDDRKAHGSQHFEHHLVQFGTEEFPDWDSVVDFFIGGLPSSGERTTRNQAWATHFLESLDDDSEKSE